MNTDFKTAAKRRWLGGSRLGSSLLWVMGGTGAVQGLRLASTLVLSRLLAPETFGLMALITTVTGALQLFSDVGLQGSVNHDSRGDDTTFLNVAWTVQAIRGAWIAALLVALAVPLAAFYRQPSLAYLLPAIAVNAILAGLTSTSVMTLVRQLKPRRTVTWQVVAKAASLVVMVALAWVWPSVWVLVIGSVVEQATRTLGSYTLIPGRRTRFVYDRESARSLMRFGRWVWIGTIATWLLGQGDKLVLGKFLDAADLGVYAMATMLTSASITAVESLAGSVLQPYYASIIRDDPASLRRKTFVVRRTLLLIVLPILWALIVFGQQVVDIIYDDRYRDAGWMLRIVAVGAVATNVMRSSEQVLLAEGNSFAHMLFKVAGGALFLAGIAIGGVLDGTRGMILGTVAARYAIYVPLALLLRKRGVWLPQLDLLAFAATGLVAGLGHWLIP